MDQHDAFSPKTGAAHASKAYASPAAYPAATSHYAAVGNVRPSYSYMHPDHHGTAGSSAVGRGGAFGDGAARAAGEGGRGVMLKGLRTNEEIALVSGLLIILALLVIWNASALERSYNFTFWVGQELPITMLVLFTMFLAFYIVTMIIIFKTTNFLHRNDHTMMLVALVFATLFGLVLIYTSMPIGRLSMDTYNNLMFRCDFSDQTSKVHQTWQVLYNIRKQPECGRQHSIEDCTEQGFEQTAETEFLKRIEDDFRRSGFCWPTESKTATQVAQGLAPSETLQSVSEKAAQPAEGTLMVQTNSTIARDKRHHGHHVHKKRHVKGGKREREGGGAIIIAADTAERTHVRGEEGQTPTPPAHRHCSPNPTIGEARCAPMLARDMKDFAADIAFTTFQLGISLIEAAVLAGFLKLIVICWRKDSGQPGEATYLTSAY
ncbi:unnamed protein product [Vitrella brassicaformis CCMP3155]|uniref:Uncharacterized protein n=1 Tax=Vitrella brassicaformis (strain CCMP3155) TaxID=1169540 RepID=A0A0G4EU18_VITBC|nr:unnamed protein product [Vitrella brassicaformis CCMP3155]|eukprot:CEM01568.1 unnamed protein product [Vitrella brassicaformis CCMP3155]